MASIDREEPGARRVDDLVQLIRDYDELAHEYEDAFDKFSKSLGKEFPRDGDVRSWRKRYDVLAVQKPFYGPYQQNFGPGPTKGQRFAAGFVEKYGRLRQRLTEYCARYNCAHLLSMAPVTDVTATNGKQITSALRKHKQILLKEDMDESRRLELRIATDFAQILREARATARKTQDEASSEIGVSLDTYKGWERGRHEPETGEKRRQAEKFIRDWVGSTQQSAESS